MHPYQIDDKVRTIKFLIAACLSVIGAWLLYLLLQCLPFSKPWWVETPSVLGFFWFFIWLFDKHLWKTKFVQHLECIRIPNISGAWKAQLKSSHDAFEKDIEGRVVIRQTASKISIALETGVSISHSIHSALLRTDKVNTFELTYNYINIPQANSLSTMNIHRGTAWLQISDDEKIMDGEYYSGRGRQNFGRLILERL